MTIKINETTTKNDICITLSFLEDDGEFDAILFKQRILSTELKQVNVFISQVAKLKEAFLRFVVKETAGREWSNAATTSDYVIFKDNSKMRQRKVVECYRTLSFEWLGVRVNVTSDFKTYDSETGRYTLNPLK